MSSPETPPAPLDEELSTFIQGPVSVVIATCDARLLTSVVFARGCWVSPDRRNVTLILSEQQSSACIADVRSTGRIAVTFGLPSTNRSVQLKGRDARIESLRPFDLACAARHTQDFMDELLPLREMSAEVLRTILRYDPDELVAISFTPAEGFTQTPGPGAGARL